MTTVRTTRSRARLARWKFRVLLLVGGVVSYVALAGPRPPTAIAATLGRESGAARLSLRVPTAGRGAGEEFAVLIVLHLTAAEMNCPYRIEEVRLKRLLNHHGFTLGDVYALSRSETLSAEFEKIVAKYRTDRQQACEIAWKNFGPGAPYEGFLQAR
jgi:hypothetical protein